MKKILFFLFFFIISVPCWAADKYVYKDAVGANNGTSWADGWHELEHVTGLSAGDTLWISGGASGLTYSTALLLDGNNATSGNRIYIRPGAAHSTLSSGHDGLVTVTVNGSAGFTIYRKYYTVDGSSNQTDGGPKKIKFIGGTHNAIVTTGAGVVIKNCDFYQQPSSDSGNAASNVTIRGAWDSSGSTEPLLGEISYNYIDDPWYMGIWSQGPTDRNTYGLILVHNNEVINFGGEDAIRADGRTDVYDNLVHDRIAVHSEGYHPDGIVTMSSYVRIFRNKIYDFGPPEGMTGYGGAFIYLNPYSATSATHCCIRIYNNLIYQTKEDKAGDTNIGLTGTWQGTGPWTSISDVYIVNNTFVHNPQWALQFLPRPDEIAHLSNFIIANNIFWDNGSQGGTLDSTLLLGKANDDGSDHWVMGNFTNDAQVIFDYNIYGGTAGNTKVSFQGTTYTYTDWKAINTGNILLPQAGCDGTEVNNPNLVAAPSYALTATSTNAIGKGRDLSALTNMDTSWPNDIDGVARPQGSAWDIGAYEYVAPTSSKGSITLTPGKGTGSIAPGKGTGTISPYYDDILFILYEEPNYADLLFSPIYGIMNMTNTRMK